MENNSTNVKVQVADPSAIGMFGLAMVTLIASSQKLGITEGLSFVIPWAFFLGGIAQLFASVQDAKHNNVFGQTAFGAYGLFWIGVGTSWLIQMGVFGEELAANVDPKQLGFAFIGYLILSLFLTVGSMETNMVLFSIFVLIDFLFIGLILSTFGVVPELAHQVAAVSELLISLIGFYGAGANVLNNHFGRVVCPVGKPFGIFKPQAKMKLVKNA
ncbi:acetate uptake transporter [Neobacillus sp. LXY-4]|uniref:acetate uptake transporter n=1 Tax=Neobacillus sp. LXY-4 TaxID=3379826 RepID=UPI003EE2D36B